jgi:hypothetical protein
MIQCSSTDFGRLLDMATSLAGSGEPVRCSLGVEERDFAALSSGRIALTSRQFGTLVTFIIREVDRIVAENRALVAHVRKAGAA